MHQVREAVRGGRRGGKRRVVVDLVERYWDEIEGDFRHYLSGLDALEWFRCRAYPECYPPGVYPWEQFIRLVVYCTKIQGSGMYHATLSDSDLVDRIYRDLIDKQSKKIVEKEEEPGVGHPPFRGYTREIEKLDDLIDVIMGLRAEMGQWKKNPPPTVRPLFPGEAAREKLAMRARRIRDEKIAASQERWRKRRAAGT